MSATDEITVDDCAAFLTSAGYELEHLAHDASYRLSAALQLMDGGMLEGESVEMVGRIARLL